MVSSALSRAIAAAGLGAFLCGVCWATGSTHQAMFSSFERERILGYWAEEGRYETSAPSTAVSEGPWQMRLTVDGSTWLWNYNRRRGLGKVAPTQASVDGRTDEERRWEAWIDAKVAYDRYLAADQARRQNEAALGRLISLAEPVQSDPGPIPPSLLELAGEPPAFASVVQPVQHRVRFHDGREIVYVDNVAMRPRYAYYRFSQGVMAGGTAVRNMSADEVDSLCTEAGITATERRVMAAVSLLEGGFDSVNTYDTGFLSVGFIQFATLSGGAGSLGAVLLRQKTEAPRIFEETFRMFGVDVNVLGQIVVLDLATGKELYAAEAVHNIIDDKRLTAVFHRAGQACRSFRVCQLKVARDMYYPANDPIQVPLPGGGTITGRVHDVVRSEAGMATLMDRKVNTGRTDPLATVLAQMASEFQVMTLEDLAALEPMIVAALRYRKDYTQDRSLSQPVATRSTPARRVQPTLSRGGRRGGG
jgi:hypothetical protein